MLLLVICYAVFIRLYKLNILPSVVNGDESASIIHPLQIIFGKVTNIFQLTHDGSVSYLVYLPKAIFIALFGLDNSLFAVRFTTGLFSILAIILFYFLLKKYTGKITALVTSLAFASNYWYLNFSRLSWIAVDSVFFGLLLLKVSQKLTDKPSIRWVIFTAVASALVLISYMGGRIYFFAVLISLGLWLIRKNKSYKAIAKIKYLMLYLFITVIIFIPQFLQIIKNKDFYFLRAASLSIINIRNPYYGNYPKEKLKILLHQVNYTIRGFVFFDPAVSSEGFENPRLIPPNFPAVNIVIILLFWLGLIVSFFKKKRDIILWIIYLLNILILQIPSIYIPSWSRAIGIIPVIYIFAGIGLEFIISKRLSKIKMFNTVIVILVLAFSLMDVAVYWNWVKSETFNLAQEPVVKVTEFKLWQKNQIIYIFSNKIPFTIDEWQNGIWRKINLKI